jgi:hypothetical protein
MQIIAGANFFFMALAGEPIAGIITDHLIAGDFHLAVCQCLVQVRGILRIRYIGHHDLVRVRNVHVLVVLPKQKLTSGHRNPRVRIDAGIKEEWCGRRLSSGTCDDQQGREQQEYSTRVHCVASSFNSACQRPR